MGEKLIDDLARALAEPMPRRRALRVMGSILIATSFPGAALARSRRPTQFTFCRRKERRCQKGADANYAQYCCGPNGNFMWCGDSRNNYQCIDKCKLAGREAGTGPWDRCGEELCCNPKVQACRRGVCVLCQPGKPLCDGQCCPPGETCQKCMESEQGGVVWFVKGRRKCCPPDSDCCGSRCHKKSDGRVCCNGKLCPRGKRCVNLDPASSGRVGLTCG